MDDLVLLPGPGHAVHFNFVVVYSARGPVVRAYAFDRQRRRQIEIKLNFTISLIISDDGLISFLNFYSCSHLIIPKLMLRSTKSREDKNESRAQIEELRITLLITRCFILDCIGIP